MLKNNNLNVCRKLVIRDILFHKVRSVILILAILLVCAMYSFTFSLGLMVRNGYLENYEKRTGSHSHITFHNLTKEQSALLASHSEVKRTEELHTFGLVTSDVLANRSISLAAWNSGYAQLIDATPTVGQAPDQTGEIALDVLTLDSLGVPHIPGTALDLEWTDPEGIERSSCFILSGYWDSPMSRYETNAWIAESTADMLMPGFSGDITLGVILHRPFDSDKQAVQLLHDCNLEDVPYSPNYSYLTDFLRIADDKARSFYNISFFIIICGVLMIYHILHLSVGRSIRFFGRLKSLGMTPRQIRWIFILQTTFLCLPAIPVGCFTGFLINTVISPLLVIGETGNPAIHLFNPAPFAVAAVLTILTTLTASYIPARFAEKTSPAAAVHYMSPVRRPFRRAGDTARKQTTIKRMAITSLKRDLFHTVMTSAALLMSMFLLCFAHTKYISYDKSIYLADMAAADYMISDGSAAYSSQRYNQEGRSITAELAEAVMSHPAVLQSGILKTREVPMKASEEQRKDVIDFFEAITDDGEVRKDAMASNPDWMEGYERFKETGVYVGVVTGLDNLALEVAMYTYPAIKGTFDAEMFTTGQYTVASGASNRDGITTPPVGSRIDVEGCSYTIMASQPYHDSLIAGANSSDAQFNITYYLPLSEFNELFPDSGIRNILVNIDPTYQKEFETFLEDLKLKSPTGLGISLRSEHEYMFASGRLNDTLTDTIVGLVLLLIAILHFINTLIAGALDRKKEFAVYESLGMTGRQLKRLVATEGILHALLLTIIVLPVTALAVWIWGEWWLANTNTWCIVYHFSLLPLWIILPVLIALSFLIPLTVLRLLHHESVTERLCIIE